MMHWDYRVFSEESGYTIRTVYYDDQGAIVACSEKPAELFGDSLTTLEEEVSLLQGAFQKQVLSLANIPAQQTKPEVKRGKSLQAVRQELGLETNVIS